MANEKQPDGRGAIPGIPPPSRGGDPNSAPAAAGLGDFAWRVVLAVLIVAVAYLLWQCVHVLLLAFAGVLFAVFLSALSGWVSERTGISYSKALALVVAALIVLAGGLGWLLADRLALQTAELTRRLPESLEEVRAYLEEYPWGRLVLEKGPEAVNSLVSAGAPARVTGIISGAVSLGVALIVILFVGIFGAAEPALYRAGFLHLVPPGERLRVAQALDAVVFNLRWWLVGQVCLMVMIGATTAVGLWLLGVPLALALGVITGVLELMPYLGAWISAVPAALIALLHGPWYLVMTLALYLGLHVLEGYVLAPLIQRRAVHLPPALTVVAQLLLGDLLGIVGLLVAAPLTVAVVVFLKMFYIEDTLGDQTVEVPGERAAAGRSVAGPTG